MNFEILKDALGDTDNLENDYIKRDHLIHHKQCYQEIRSLNTSAKGKDGENFLKQGTDQL